MTSAAPGQAFYPQSLIPQVLLQVKQDYLKQSNDPVVGKLEKPEMAWFYMAVVLELVWQCPAFVLGIWGLVRGTSRLIIIEQLTLRDLAE